MIASKHPKDVFNWLLDHTEEVDVSEIPVDSSAGGKVRPKLVPIPIESFELLIEEFDSRIFWSDSLSHTLAVAIAIHFSVKLTGDMLWMHICAPPSSGKSTILDCVNADTEGVFHVSYARGIYSGAKGVETIGDKINGKLLVIKDLTTTLQTPGHEIIFGQLRDLYDGYGSAEYLNGKTVNFDGMNFAILTGVTDELRRHNSSSLGERFLVIELADNNHGTTEQAQKISGGVVDSMQAAWERNQSDDADTQGPPDIRKESIVHLQRCTVGFMNHLRDTNRTWRFPVVPSEVTEKLSHLAELVAKIRTKVQRNQKGNELLFMPRSEKPFRLITQFTKLMICLSRVLGKSQVDADVYRLIRKVALDTVAGITFDVFQSIADRPDGITMKGIKNLNRDIPSAQIDRIIQDFRLLKIIRKETKPGDKNTHEFRLSAEMRAVWRSVHEDPVFEAPKKRFFGAKKPRRFS